MKVVAKFWFFIGVLAALSPLGLLLPEHFKAGPAWGEWGVDEIRELTGYLPKGLEKLANLWEAPVSDYTFKAWGQKRPADLSLTYILSAIIGVMVCAGVMLLIAKFLVKNK